LNDPLRWNGSAFKQTVPPHRASSVLEVSNGVRWTIPASRAVAA
jgi:hypothetical protein